jgi:hypothetical protein
MTSTMERLDKYRGQVQTQSGPASYIDTGGPALRRHWDAHP